MHKEQQLSTRQEQGRVIANFGPLSLDGGENRLNVAITRAKEDLKIYWTPETEKKILEGLSLRNYKKDAALLAAMQNL